MNTIYVITSGEYSDYGIHSVWSNKEEAEAKAGMLSRSTTYADYRVEEYLLNTMHDTEKQGYVATYDFEKHGYSVDIKNVVVEDTIINSYYAVKVDQLGKSVVVGRAYTAEAVCKIIFDKVAQLHAEKQGLC